MTQDAATAGHSQVRIRGPLPMDVAGSLLTAVGTLYPGTRIANSQAGDALNLLIPDTDRPAMEGLDFGEPLEVIRLDTSGLSVTTPTQVATVLAATMESALAEHPAAENYLEMKLQTPDGEGGQYVLIFARSEGQTPHELKVAAEDEVSRLRGQVADLRRRIAVMQTERER